MYFGKASIKNKIGKKGFFGIIELRADLIKDRKIELKFEDERSLKWKDSIKGGARYFYEKEFGSKKAGLEINIIKCQDIIIDSSFLVFFYLTYGALCEAFGLQKEIEIDNDGNFVIPK